MARKPHPAEVRDAQLIARATSFVIYLRSSPGTVHRETATSIPEARQIEARMNKEHGANGRRAIIYAILPEGGQVFVPDTMQ
jgi:hypothetical protein